ncbi:universal stress protein [Histidinibacterium aquaticum]|nr:universal stress protein [Histidinibacterium aquaticum]
MPIKSILTFYDGSAASETQLGAAITLAKRFDAHIDVAVIAYVQSDLALGSGGGPMGRTPVRQAEDEAKTLSAPIRERLAAEKLLGRTLPLVTRPEDLGRTFGDRARYTDLVVLAKPIGNDYYNSTPQSLEGALFRGDGAVLVCPEGPVPEPHRVLIAWDGSPPALHAVRRALTFLTGARMAEIVMVNPADDVASSADDLSVLLTHHGMSARVSRIAAGSGSDARILAQAQSDTGADWIIAGAYGHSRFRELLLGGVTRELPTLTKVPLFMVH